MMMRLLLVALVSVPALAHPAVWPCSPCEQNGTADSCCCMYCGSNGTTGPFFSCMTVQGCLASGGQCKHWKTSAYARPKKAARARLSRGRKDGPEQHHLVAGYPGDVTLVFVTYGPGNSSVEVRSGERVRVYTGTRAVYSAMHTTVAGNGWAEGWNHGYDDDLFDVPAKVAICGPGAEGYTSPNCRYTSRYIHTITISDLQPGSSYEYRAHGASAWTPFRTWPAVGQPISFGVLGDLGQTTDSLATMRHLAAQFDARKMHGVLFAGDLSYADGFGDAWDTYGRLGEFLWGRAPTTYITGNHEWSGEQFQHFLARYPSPTQKRSGSDSPLWYSLEAGLAHFVGLCSYCDIAEGSAQLEWLRQDLASVDRTRTPWLVVMAHVPMYTSNRHHPMTEGDVMRDNIDDLLYSYKADVVFTGHLHAYERTVGIHRNSSVCDGPVHVVIGDGGNHEGPACPWYQKELPSWGAHREYSFGHGLLQLFNATHGKWSWHRNQDGDAVDADWAWLDRSPARCGRPTDIVV